MRQVCPNCQRLVDMPDGATEVNCPGCQTSVHAPETYAIRVDPAVVPVQLPPPPPAPPTQPALPPPPAAPSAPSFTLPPVDPNRPAPPPGYALPTQAIIPPSQGYASNFPIALSPSVLPWLTAGGLVLVLLLTPFPWNGAYPGGSTAYSQSYWGALTSSFSSTIPFEMELKQESAIQKQMSWNWWLLLPYLFVVLAGAGLAIADRLVTAPDFAFRIGPFGTARALVWPRRTIIIAGLAAGALVLFGLQSLRGFNLPNAVKAVAEEKYADELSKVDNSADRDRMNAKIAIEKARFGLAHGFAWWFVGLAHLITTAAAGLVLWLDARGHAPPPRLVAEW